MNEEQDPSTSEAAAGEAANEARPESVPDSPEAWRAYWLRKSEEAGTAAPCACRDCGLPYEQFGLDVSAPQQQWNLIHPEGEGGLLCANCIVRRGAVFGATVLQVWFDQLAYPASFRE